MDEPTKPDAGTEFRATVSQRVMALSEPKRRWLAGTLAKGSAGLLGRADAHRAATRLVAYVVPTSQGSDDVTVLTDELRAFAQDRLPGHMVPDTYVAVSELPTGTTGKVDRRALARIARSAARTARPGSERERSATEEQLAEIWCEVLGQPGIHLGDNFFELGGHSLLAVRLLGKVRDAFDLEVEMEAVFEAPTVAQLALYIDTLRWAREGASDDTSGDERLEEFEL